jgi:hypothetical protein
MMRFHPFAGVAIAGGLLAIVALAGCANPAPISANPVQTAGNDINSLLPGATGPIQTQLINAEWNLDQAIGVGALPATDPADACMHSTLKSIGIEPPPAGTTATPVPSFVPRETGLIDTGAALYIQAQEAKQLAGFTLPSTCYAIVGMFIVDAAKLGIKILPGGGLLP